MPLRVIGAGFGRTGTNSLKLALEQIGFGPCHHMFEVRDNPDQLSFWQAAARGELPDWHEVFAGYSAQVDWPGARYWRELAACFPDAKVILSVRPADEWFDSFQATIAPFMRDRAGHEDLHRRAMAEMGYELIGRQVFGGRMDDRDHAMRVFRDHITLVQATIAPERLLTFRAHDGWEPLCRFLGVAVPEAPFPHANSTETFHARRIARRIFAANRDRERFRPLRGEDAPESMDAAYRIQDEVHRLFEVEGGLGPLGGHKIALTSRAVQELCGVDRPAYGAVFASVVRRSPAVLRAADFMHLGLEFELAVLIGRDVPAAGAPYDRATIAPYVEACMPAFELIEDRHADYGDLDAESILTDRCWCAGVVLGAPVADWRNLDLATAPIELIWNGEVVDRGVAGDSMGHPLEGLAWVANHLAARGRAMAKGEIVITGSALKTRFPEIGDEVTYKIQGVGETTIRLDP
jgi:2-keto-4-pentenoate hydratase